MSGGPVAALRFVPLTPDLLNQAIAAQPPGMAALLGTAAYRARLLSGESPLALIDGGRLAVVGGFVQHWHGRGEGWWLVTHLARRRHLVAAARRSVAVMDRLARDPGWVRIEMNVRSDAPWGGDFAWALGFRHVARLHRWAPDGADYDLYERVQGDD